jgi:hypothetical protein
MEAQSHITKNEASLICTSILKTWKKRGKIAMSSLSLYASKFFDQPQQTQGEKNLMEV